MIRSPGARLRLADLHWPFLGVVLLICALGVYNMHSSAAARDPDLFLTQAGWMLLGAGLVVVFLFVDYRFTETIAYPLFGLVLVMLAFVLVEGKVAKGASRWIVAGPVTFQPSELAKLAAVFCLARYFSTRMVPGGYSLGLLIKPLNPSRPLVLIAALLVSWNKPFLADPVGASARLLRDKLRGTFAVIDDLLWFRALLVLGLVAFATLAVVGIVRYERRVALLNPWPRGQRRRLIGVVAALTAALGAVLAWSWQAPLLADPFGVIVNHLIAGAAPGGPYEALAPSLGLRLTLLAAALVYLLWSILNLRLGATSFIDVVIAPLDLLAVPALLILVQPDLGTAGILMLIAMTMMLVVGVRLRSLVILAIIGAMFSGVGWFGVLKDYQKRRILTFIDPEHDTQGAGWNAVQSMIAVGSGQWTGKGHKGGTQTQLSFLPEQHTDFAFSVWAEEQGFLGSVLLVGLYLLLILFGFGIAAEAREHYGGLLAVGATATILWQTLINISMVAGAFPVVGITLPLFSYGGTSVLSVMGAVAILLNVHWRRRAGH